MIGVCEAPITSTSAAPSFPGRQQEPSFSYTESRLSCQTKCFGPKSTDLTTKLMGRNMHFKLDNINVL